MKVKGIEAALLRAMRSAALREPARAEAAMAVLGIRRQFPPMGDDDFFSAPPLRGPASDDILSSSQWDETTITD